MIELLHTNGNTYSVTPQAFDKIKLRHNWQATYTVVSEPEPPKEIVGAAKAKKPAESVTHGLSTNDARPIVEDAGQEQ